MAKLALIFICAFLFVQYASAGLIKRDAPQPNDAQKTFENALSQLQTFIQNSFSQEQLEKMSKDLKDFGDTLNTKGKEFLDQAETNFNKLKAQ